MIDDLYFVIKNSVDEYLVDPGCPGSEVWRKDDGWHYQSRVVFADAELVCGEVYLVLPEGREVLVSESDFLVAEE